jgi:hypothetical protein
MTPVFDQVRKDTGITIRPTYMGTLDAVDLLAKGKVDGQYDALWLSSNDYLRLRPDAAKKVVSETSIMSSPVAIGVKTATVQNAGLDAGQGHLVADRTGRPGRQVDLRHDGPGSLQLRFLHPDLGGLRPLRRPVGAHRRGRHQGDSPAEGVLQGAEADVRFVGLAGSARINTGETWTLCSTTSPSSRASQV